MVYGLGLLLATIFAVLGLFHLYWAMGGRWGNAATVPSAGEKRIFHPSPLGTVLVALALFVAMLTILGQLDVWGTALPRWIFRWGTWSISFIFFLRAVGEFRFIGFFKRIRDTRFAYWDTWLFSPLCLLISIIACVVAYHRD